MIAIELLQIYLFFSIHSISTYATTYKIAHSMSFNHFTEQIFDDTIIDNRITAINAKDMKNHHDFLYPYNLTVFRTIPTLDNIRLTTGTDVDKFENSKLLMIRTKPLFQLYFI